MVDDFGVEIVPEGVIEDGGVPEVPEACQEIIEIERQIGIDIIEAHDVLECKHDG
jgi:hypothetical protein